MADGTQIEKRGRGRPYPPTALQSADPQDILTRYLNDESTEDIAHSYGVSRGALYYYLRTKAEGVWRESQVTRALSVKEKADERLEAIQARIDAFKTLDKETFEREKEACRLQLQLAREQASRAEWELERLMSRLYGQKQEVAVEHKYVIEVPAMAADAAAWSQSIRPPIAGVAQKVGNEEQVTDV